MKTHTFAYIRVSTDKQDEASQRFEIENYCKRAGLAVNGWVSEAVSGTLPIEKRALGGLLDGMQRGDLLICCELSRIGRNMLMIMGVLNRCIEQGIIIQTIKDNFRLCDDINSKIIAFAFSLSAEIERMLISQRTREALAHKKAQGVKLGRPVDSSAKWDAFCEHYDDVQKLRATRTPLTQIAALMGISRNTLRQYITRYEEENDI